VSFGSYAGRTERTHSGADRSARRPEVYGGREVRTQCVDEVVEVHVWRNIQVAGAGRQSGEIDSVGLYGRDIGVNKIMALDRFREVGSRGATRASPWLEELCVRYD
jgi:hypothetical protein